MIFISAGHNENRQGASFDETTEYMLTTNWADEIAEILGDQCLRVPNGTLKEKVGFINSLSGPNIAVEIHFNSAKKWKDLDGDGVIDANELINVGRGSETLYYPSSKNGEEAAIIIQNAMAQVFKPDRGVKPGWYQMNPAKGADYFLAKTNCTALIIEPEFIDNLNIIDGGMVSACHAIASALLEINND